MDVKALKDLAEAVRAISTPKTVAYDTPAKVTRIEDGVAWVHIDGGVEETPVKLTIAAQPGDIVQVRVGGGTAWLVGNASAPPTDDKTANAAQKSAKDADDKAVTADRKATEADRKAGEAGKVATNYITDTTSDGVFVHPEGNTQDGVRIQDTVEILRDGASVAEYGDTIRLGPSTGARVEIGASDMKIRNGSNALIGQVGSVTGANIVRLGTNNTYALASGSSNPTILLLGSGNSVAAGAENPIVVIGAGSTLQEKGVSIGNGNSVWDGTVIGNHLWIGASSGDMALGQDGAMPDGCSPFVIGTYNSKYQYQASYAFIIGGGSGENYRSDILRVSWGGSIFLNGDANVNGSMYSGFAPSGRKKMFVTESHTLDNQTAAASTSSSFSLSVAKTGYTPMAVKSVIINNASTGGTASSFCFPYYWGINGNTFSIGVRNTASGTAAKIQITVNVFYIASSAL